MSNYPPGAENDPNAPYNQTDDELELNMSITYSLTANKVNIITDAYYATDIDEDGAYIELVDEHVDYRKCFEEQYLTPIQLINYLKELMIEKLKENPDDIMAKNIIYECSMWDMEFVETEK